MALSRAMARSAAARVRFDCVEFSPSCRVTRVRRSCRASERAWTRARYVADSDMTTTRITVAAVSSGSLRVSDQRDGAQERAGCAVMMRRTYRV